MKRLVILGVITGLLVTVLSPAWAGTINTSKSNTFRLTYSADLVSQAQANAILAELGRLGRPDEAQLRQWLLANLGRHGIPADRIKKTVILLPSRERDQAHKVADPNTWVILLADPADEAQAIALIVKAIQEELASSEPERREGEMDGDGGGGY